jgi:hypothetical protein
LIHFPVKGGNVYGKKVVNHYRSCCDCLIIDSGMHYPIDSKSNSGCRGKLSELTNRDDSGRLSELTNAVGHANSSDTHFGASNVTTNSGDSRRNSSATDNATREPSILQRPVRGEY